MNGRQNESSGHSLQDRKARIILMGAGFGALLGLISSYLYTRAAEEHGEPGSGAANSVSTGQLLALLLAILGLVRQIAELGKPKTADKNEKK